MNLLGLLYFHGKDTRVERDRARAYALFCEAGRGGFSCALCNSGMCQEMGAGTPVDLAGAMNAYTAGARLGSARAMYNIGYLLIRYALDVTAGQGLMTEDGSAVSAEFRSRVIGQFWGPSAHPPLRSLWTQQLLEQDWALHFSEGIRWLRSALEGGVAEAGYQLARLYETVGIFTTEVLSSLFNCVFVRILRERAFPKTGRPHMDTMSGRQSSTTRGPP